MARVRYLLEAILIWLFILVWWILLVEWAFAGAWPMGLLPSFAWPFCMLVLAVPPIMAYVSWERLWGRERRRSHHESLRREQLRRANENERSLSEVVQRPLRQGSPHPTIS